jgi:hypothetical protein
MYKINSRLATLLSTILLSSELFSGQVFTEKCASYLTDEEIDQLYEG